MAAGEVLLNGSQLGTAGSSGFPLSNLLDASNQTAWTTYPTTLQPWAGMDAGANCTLTRIRTSVGAGSSDLDIGAYVQGSSNSTFPGTSAIFGFVQANYNYLASSNHASITCPFASDNTAGNCIVVFVAPNATSTAPTISDIPGNTYTLATGPANGSTTYCWVAANIAGTLSANTVTINFTGTPSTFPVIMILEYSGASTTTPIDVAANNSGTGTAMSVNYSPTNANDLAVVFGEGSSTYSLSVESGYTMRVHGSTTPNAGVEEGLPGVTGSVTSTMTQGTSSAWNMTAVALKPQTLPVTTVTIYTVSARPFSGTLINEYDVSPGSQYRYYRYVSGPSAYGGIADLDFIVSYTPGITAQCCTPTISPPGGDYDQPIVVQFSCITTDASLYYTLDGTTPTPSSTLYTGPIVIPNCTLSIIGVSPGLTNSRVSQYIFHVPSSFVSTDPMTDDRNQVIGYRCISPSIFQDPISGWWWMWGWDMDEPGVVTAGFIGISAYYSADLRNWKFAGYAVTPAAGLQVNDSLYKARPAVFYNALNKNYVMWLDGGNEQVYKATNPAGPWTLYATYTTFLGLTAGGDSGGFFQDIDLVTTYIITEIGPSDTTLLIARLNANYDNIDGVNYVTYSNSGSSPFGQKAEAYSMFFRNNTYFFMASGYSYWQPNTNLYVTNTTGPLGTWSAPANPFQNVTVPQTSSEAAVGVTPTYTNAYDSQNVGPPMTIPGRNAFIYLGDRYCTGLTYPTSSSTTANMWAYRRLTLPMVFPTSSSMTLTWTGAWSLDSVFPTVSGAPYGAGLFTFASGNFSWMNTTPGPANIYLDYSLNANFSPVLRSEVITLNGSAASGYAPIFTPKAATGYYRIRTVNANGTAFSSLYQIPPAPILPPYTPPWYLVPPQSPPYIPPSASPSSTSPSVAGYYIVYDSSGAFIIMYLIPGVDYGPNGLWFQGQIQSIYSGPYTDYPTAVIALRNVPSVFGQGPNL
jgi:Chitobiase/beta-hexosaminidase C-terminal domain